MLEQVTASNGVLFLQSPLLTAAGIPHGFSTRLGGVSQGAFATLNLGNPGQAPQDVQANILENFLRFQSAIGAPAARRAWVHQVHGCRVERIDAEPEGEYAQTLAAELRDRFSGQTQADGLLTNEPGVLLTVRIADCVPILLARDDGTEVAAVHAGWRGIASGAVLRAVEQMRQAGASPGRILAAIGPAIGPEAFEVGPDVVAAFEQAGLHEAVLPASRAAKPHIDLQHAVRLQLTRTGITRIDGNHFCTHRDAHLFFSHRRENGRTGRLAAAITPNPRT